MSFVTFTAFWILCLHCLAASATSLRPFQSAEAVDYLQSHVLRRQDQCLSNQRFCPGTNGNSGCCSTNSQCATDDSGHIACCQNGAVCTGSLGDNTASLRGGTTTAPATAQTRTTATISQVTDNSPGRSIVVNPYFPYVYLPTTYQNADQCSAAFSSCRSEFSQCSSSLATGGNDVTISGAGGGITAQPALGPASAGAICSSLSTKACYNLGLGNCPMYGTAAATGGGGTFSAGNVAPTRCAQLYRVGVAVAVGVAGQAMR